MADVEDDAEMGSHFLDSMLEVEMTEEDVELDVSKNEDPLDGNSLSLPPVPTFDLQSETLSFKDVYRNQMQASPVISPIPRAQTNTPGILPLNVGGQSRPILQVQSRDTPVKILPSPLKPNSPIQKNILKSNIKLPIKPVVVRNGGISEEDLASQFLKKVFKPEYVKNVFVKPDPPHDISQIGKEEMEYYKACFKDLSKIQYCRLHCTICDKHLGCGVNVEKKATVHQMLKVLTCKQCFGFYGDGNFPCDKGDNCEIYCRWCGQGGALVCCSYCPRVFCKKCVRQNFGPPFLRSIQGASDWACFCCAQKPLWPHRAVCRALMKYIAQLKADPKALQLDTSKCCSSTILNKKRMKPMDKNNTTPQAHGINIVGKNSTVPFFKSSSVQPVKTISGKQPVLKSHVQIKIGDQNKIPMKSANVFNKTVTSSILPSGTVITGNNNILRNFAAASQYKTYPGLPQLIQSPVLHGETLITPPVSKMVVPQKTPIIPNPTPVKVSITTPAPSVDISKIPSVKIPHDVQGLVLRMCFPDNKVQLVRLLGDRSECKAANEFPIPEFKNLDELAFVEENLAGAFKLSKMIYDKLMLVREKVNSRTKFTEESVFASSVKKLHSIYEKSAELLKELDKSLLENFEVWKNQAKNPVDVIDISDEDSKSGLEKNKRCSNFYKKCKELLHSDDSDVEILDIEKPTSDGVEVNVSNRNEKFRLRGSTSNSESDKNVKNTPMKRKTKLTKKSKRLKANSAEGEGKKTETKENEDGNAGEENRENTENAENTENTENAENMENMENTENTENTENVEDANQATEPEEMDTEAEPSKEATDADESVSEEANAEAEPDKEAADEPISQETSQKDEEKLNESVEGSYEEKTEEKLDDFAEDSNEEKTGENGVDDHAEEEKVLENGEEERISEENSELETGPEMEESPAAVESENENENECEAKDSS